MSFFSFELKKKIIQKNSKPAHSHISWVGLGRQQNCIHLKYTPYFPSLLFLSLVSFLLLHFPFFICKIPFLHFPFSTSFNYTRIWCSSSGVITFVILFYFVVSISMVLINKSIFKVETYKTLLTLLFWHIFFVFFCFMYI